MAAPQTNSNAPVGPLTHHLVYHALLPVGQGGGAHHAIYVESNLSWGQPSGWIFKVTGDPSISPMTFDDRDCKNPLVSGDENGIRRVGWVFCHGHVEEIRAVCQSVPPPGPLPANQTPSDSEGWALNAINALTQAGVLQPLRPEDPTGFIFRGH